MIEILFTYIFAKSILPIFDVTRRPNRTDGLHVTFRGNKVTLSVLWYEGACSDVANSYTDPNNPACFEIAAWDRDGKWIDLDSLDLCDHGKSKGWQTMDNVVAMAKRLAYR